jgi:N-acetylglucosamine-6-sulfatase
MGYKAVRNGRWKYIRYLELEGMDELYDLKTDPYELKNLIHQSRAAKARDRMKQEMERLLRETTATTKLPTKSTRWRKTWQDLRNSHT